MLELELDVAVKISKSAVIDLAKIIDLPGLTLGADGSVELIALAELSLHLVINIE